MPLEDYEEFYDEQEVRKMNHKSFMEGKRNDRRRKRSAKAADVLNEVGVVPDPTPERIEAQEYYKKDYVKMHQDLFPRSTGMKPFGQVQIDSINRTKDILDSGGKLVIAEPRGYAKTSRTSNHALMAILQGKIKYAIILASSVRKASDILESIKTELMDNEKLYELYPAPLECFQHLDEKPVKARTQTYGGNPTHIGWGIDRIRFPVIPGEPSSGSIIQVRSKDNVRGLFTKIRYGEHSGTILRPDFFFMDDIQTDEEARNVNSVQKIVTDIKKSVLFAGSHSKRISGVMCCTPICAGDVSSHFILHEHSWEVVCYKMVEKMPDNLKLWLTEYAQILQAYDRYEAGSRKKAELRAKQFVLDNYEELHRGAVTTWDWAYGWNEDPVVEVSALHHAMNFLIMEGQEAFESECQCRIVIESESVDQIKVTAKEIEEKYSNVLQRYEIPLDTQYIVTHVDVNSEILTSVTVASSDTITPHIVDYGTYPPQEGAVWQKGNLVNTLSNLYRNDIPKDELGLRIYQSVKDYLTILYGRAYSRQDGISMQNTLIMVDCNYEKEEVMKAIRDLPFATSIQPCFGTGIAAKDRPMADKNYGPACVRYHLCINLPSRGYQTMQLMMDTNYFKKKVHDGWKTRAGFPGSISIFPPEYLGQHNVFIKHMLAEDPARDFYEKENREVYLWVQGRGQDNEFFDNLVATLAGLCKLGAQFRQQKSERKLRSFDMGAYIEAQKDKPLI